MSQKVLLETQPLDGVVQLMLNRPEVLNAIDMALCDSLLTALDRLAKDDTARVLVLTGAGDRAFCSGFDIQEMASFDAKAMNEAFVHRDPLFLKVARFPKPVVAVLNGVAYGAGAILAAAADIRVGSPTMRFKVTASNYGSANATWLLPGIVGIPRAKEILFAGRVVEAEEALSIGLVNHLYEGDVIENALRMAAIIAANPPEGVRGIKQLIDDGKSLSTNDAYHAEFSWMQHQFSEGGRGGAAVFSSFLARHSKPNNSH